MKRYLTETYSNLDKNLFLTDQQLKNYLSYKKKKLGMKSRLNLGEFEQWSLKHEKIPEDPEEMFHFIQKIQKKNSFYVFRYFSMCSSQQRDF